MSKTFLKSPFFPCTVVGLLLLKITLKGRNAALKLQTPAFKLPGLQVWMLQGWVTASGQALAKAQMGSFGRVWGTWME